MSSSSDDMIKAATASDNSVNSSCKKKMSIIPKFFGSKRNGRESSDEDMFQADGHIRDSNTKITPRKKAFLEGSLVAKKKLTERHSSPEIVGLNLSEFGEKMAPKTVIQDIRVFVATWNVGGKTPSHGLNLEDFLQVEGSSDLYILGFQEIVPLSAGNVLVVEDNEPAARWLTLINQALNKPQNDSTHSSSDSNSKQQNESKSNFFHKPSLKVLSRNLRADSRLLKACNCPPDSPLLRPRKLSNDPFIDEFLSVSQITPSPKRLSYNLIASKQMVGIFLSVWARNELVRHIGHLRISCVGRGIMGCLGNKGCIAVSLSVHQTSFCFVCSHLASGEKEGDEIKRNADVNEIMKSTEFSKVCKDPNSRIPEKINDHDRIMWLGDLNYRVALSYEKTRILLEDNDWDSLLQMDQLNIEREAGRVFSGWDEGKIFFAPTYKYSHNSDSYAGETIKSKKKRRTPAWCDRILWRGNGIEQLSYIRGESRFSDHRPVCAVFAVEVEMVRNRTTKCCNGYTFGGKRLLFEDCIPQRHSFYE